VPDLWVMPLFDMRAQSPTPGYRVELLYCCKTRNRAGKREHSYVNARCWRGMPCSTLLRYGKFGFKFSQAEEGFLPSYSLFR